MRLQYESLFQPATPTPPLNAKLRTTTIFILLFIQLILISLIILSVVYEYFISTGCPQKLLLYFSQLYQ